MNTPEHSQLGKASAYVDQYDPALLFPIPRAASRVSARAISWSTVASHGHWISATSGQRTHGQTQAAVTSAHLLDVAVEAFEIHEGSPCAQPTMRRMWDDGVARIAVRGLAGRCQYSQ